MKALSFLRHLLAAIALFALLGLAYAHRNVIVWALDYVQWPHDSRVRAGLLRQDFAADDFKTVASGFRAPWGIAFLPDGGILVTERSGTLQHILPDGAVAAMHVAGVSSFGESGLLGVAVHPDFTQTGWVYLYSTYAGSDGGLKNRVDRYRLEGEKLEERSTVVKDIPGASRGNGGALAFGADRKLYIATGDGNDETTAQDLRSLGGKILRLNDDGSTPHDNPFGTPVWSYGHRNPEGLAWDGKGRLWATERGSGFGAGEDELNLIARGKNYGWPTAQGSDQSQGTTSPVVVSERGEVWAPSGATWYGSSVIFGGLRSKTLYQAAVDESPVIVRAHFTSEYGRIRAAAVGPDKMLYLMTSNTDGRGMPKEGDDRLIRINPRLFQ